jgi:outer membrane protein TolC
MREDMPGLHESKDVMDRYELNQMVMFPTKLVAERDAALAGAAAAREGERESGATVVRDVRAAYAMLWGAQEQGRFNRENQATMEAFVNAAGTRYSVGATSQNDLLKARVELAMIRNEGATLRRQEHESRAMLASLLGREAGSLPGRVWIPDVPPSLPPLETLLSRASAARPMLRADSLMVEENRAMLSLARQGYLPDLALGVQYQNMRASDYDGWMLKAGVTVPVAPWSLFRQGAEVERAEAGVRKAEAVYRSSRTMLAASVRSLHARAEENLARLQAFDTEILPRARESLEAGLRGYQTGGADFLMLLDSYRVLVELRRERIMARMEYEQVLANLEWAAGLAVPDPERKEEGR